MRAIVLRPGRPAEQTLAPADAYEWIKAALGGGWLDAVPLADRSTMYVDADAAFKDLPTNETATALARHDRAIGNDYEIRGPAVIVGGPDERGVDSSLPVGSALRILSVLYGLDGDRWPR